MDLPKTSLQTPRWMPRLLVAGFVLSALALGGCSTESNIQPRGNVTSEPVVDARLAEDDFAFPPNPLPLSQGYHAFQNNCIQCHTNSYWQQQKVKEDMAYSTPIDYYLFLSRGETPAVVMPTEQRRAVFPKAHLGKDGQPMRFRQNMSRDDRWAVIMYTRYLAGAGDIQKPNDASPEVANIFGGNCAVCHGKRGHADGPLHVGKTGDHHLHDAPLHNDLLPAPARFDDFRRMYNRTDAQIFKYVCEGIYPSAMPAWYGNVNYVPNEKTQQLEVQYVFDHKLIWNLVRYVRGFSYVNDLKDLQKKLAAEHKDLGFNPDTPPAGLQSLQSCGLVPTNRPWTRMMEANRPDGRPWVAPKMPEGYDVTGGMTFQSRKGEEPVSKQTPADQGGR